SDEKGDLTAVIEEAKIDRPVGELVGDGVLVFPVIVIAVDQSFPVLIYAVKIKDPAGTAQSHLDVRIDLHLYCAVGKEEILIFIYPEYGDADAGRQTGCKTDDTVDPFFSVFRIF